MPTYVCVTSRDFLDAARRKAVAAAISRAHHEATGAPTFLVQVVFEEKDATQRFLGGQACDGHVWVRGDIRAGRTPSQRTGLMRAIMRGVASITGIAESEVWVYLCELHPTDMIEYGHVLPEPGAEQAWFDNLPSALRDYLNGMGPREDTFSL